MASFILYWICFLLESSLERLFVATAAGGASAQLFSKAEVVSFNKMQSTRKIACCMASNFFPSPSFSSQHFTQDENKRPKTQEHHDETRFNTETFLIDFFPSSWNVFLLFVSPSYILVQAYFRKLSGISVSCFSLLLLLLFLRFLLRHFQRMNLSFMIFCSLRVSYKSEGNTLFVMNFCTLIE